MIKLRDIVGQPAAIQTIRSAHQSGRLPHGLIFAGPTGVGKATTASALAALFLCQTPGPEDACGKCQSCRAIEAAMHPDLHIVTKELARLHDQSGKSKATQLGINVIRHELAEPASRKTSMGQGKVFIVEEAELMSSAAQNALLKTLEEPFGRTLIILLTTHGNELLPTVRSRCQIVRFIPLDEKLVERELIHRRINPSQAREAAEICNGSLGVALRWIEDDVLAPARDVAAAIDGIFTGSHTANLSDLLRKSADAHAERVLSRDELASKDFAVRGGVAMYLSIASARLRHWLAESDDSAILETACEAIDAIARAEKYLDANVNIALILEQLSMTLRPRTIQGERA